MFVVVCFSSITQAQQTDQLDQSMSIDDARHLLARTGIGASASDVAKYTGLSRSEGIRLILKGIDQKPDIAMPDWVSRPAPHYHARVEMFNEDRLAFNRQRDAELEQLRQWWVLNMLQTSSPQTERLVLFWHDLFATNVRDIGKHPLKMARQNQLFRQLGFGSWELLLKAMIRDAALLAFLDAGSNHKAAPNENLARELMELFVLGEGNYDETTVKNAARALTGHDNVLLHNLEFQLKSGVQDRDNKQLFGQSGPFGGDDFIEILLQQEAAAEFLASRFWNAFVADSKPHQGWLADQSQRFRESGYAVSELYLNVLQSEAFWAKHHRGAIIKSPVDLVIGTARTLDYPMKNWQNMPDWQSKLGMNLFEPPNVAGWTEGASFVTPGLLLNRYHVMSQLTGLAEPMAASGNTMMSTASEATNQRTANDGFANDVATGDTQMQMSSRPSDSIMQIPSQTFARTGMDEGNGSQSSEQVSTSSNEQRSNRQQLAPERGMAASAVHLMRATTNKADGARQINLLLDHVYTPQQPFDNIRISIEKKPDTPLMLKVGSFACWPDCIESWPENCGWRDKFFPARRTLSFPWVAEDNKRWSASTSYQCQFNSLSSSEKKLISSLWSNLPVLLTSIRQTKRFTENKGKWSPIVDFIEAQFAQQSFDLDDTAYAKFADALSISEEYAPVESEPEIYSPPATSVNGIEPIIRMLAAQNLQLHQLLLPDLESVVSVKPLKSGGTYQDSASYLEATISNPLFQLK